MKEAQVDSKITRFLWRQLGLWPIPSMDAVICYKCKTKIVPSRGRPDILILNPTGRSYVCEAKAVLSGQTSFSMDDITAKQREWLQRWADDGGIGFIGLGVIRKHGKVDKLDHLYLIPWPKWLEAESLVRPHQASIPLKAGPGFRKTLQEEQLDILHLFADYELVREGGCWHLPLALQETIGCERTNEER
jgi:hypothetical protein